MKLFIKYGLLLTLSCWLVVKGILPAWGTVYSDFSNYYVSSSLVMQGGQTDSLYDNEWFQAQIKSHGIDTPGKFSPFPPLTAWIMLPLVFTDALSAMRIWVVMNLLLLAMCVFLIRELTHWKWSSSALMMMVIGNGLISNFKFGQIYLLITVCMFLIIWLDKRSSNWVAGILLGIISWIKYFPLVMIAGFLILKKNKIVLATGLSIAGLLILQYWIFGSSLMKEFFITAFLPHLDGDLSGQDVYSYYFQSWDGLFRNAFVFSKTNNPAPWIDWAAGRILGKFLIGSIVVICLYRSLKKIMTLRISGDEKKVICLSLPMLAAFVILPVTASYHFVMLVVPMSLLLNCDLFNMKEKITLSLIYAFIGFIPYGFFFSLAENAGLLFAYPRLWLISILYFGFVWVIHRASVRSNPDSKFRLVPII